jgi:anionic cell wall polymer biosynthesis LytR-Cps2A-Psr (LCP) family protein
MTRIALIFVVALVAALFGLANAKQASIFINAGGSSYKDSLGQWWEKDNSFNVGKNFSDLFWIFNTNNVDQGTNDKNIYRSNRYDDNPAPPNLIYNITGKNIVLTTM